MAPVVAGERDRFWGDILDRIAVIAERDHQFGRLTSAMRLTTSLNCSISAEDV